MTFRNVTKKQSYHPPYLATIELNADIDCLRSSMDNFVDAPEDWAVFEEEAFEE